MVQQGSSQSAAAQISHLRCTAVAQFRPRAELHAAGYQAEHSRPTPDTGSRMVLHLHVVAAEYHLYQQQSNTSNTQKSQGNKSESDDLSK